MSSDRDNSLQAALESHGIIEEEQAIALVTTNLEMALGSSTHLMAAGDDYEDIVAYGGGDLFNFESKVVAIVSPRYK